MFDVAMETLRANLMVAFVGLLMAWGLLRLWDWAMGISFRKDVWPQLKAGNGAMGRYFGWRVVGVLVFFGLCFSRAPY